VAFLQNSNILANLFCHLMLEYKNNFSFSSNS
jgi:hypothetical protein